VLSPGAFLPLGTGFGRFSAGMRWGLSGSRETGCCTGTLRSGRSPQCRCRGIENGSHRTSVCCGTPVRWPGSTIPTFPSSSMSSKTTGRPGWCSRLPRTGFPTVRSVMSCATTARSRRSGRPRPASRFCRRSGRRTPWACCTATSDRATSCSAPGTGRCSRASAWSPRPAAGRRWKYRGPVVAGCHPVRDGGGAAAVPRGRPVGGAHRRRQRSSGSAQPRGPAVAGDQRPAPQGRGCPARRRRPGLAAPAGGRCPRCPGTGATGGARWAAGRCRPRTRRRAEGEPEWCGAGQAGHGPACPGNNRRRARRCRGGLHPRVRPPRGRAFRGSAGARRSSIRGTTPGQRAQAALVPRSAVRPDHGVDRMPSSSLT